MEASVKGACRRVRGSWRKVTANINNTSALTKAAFSWKAVYVVRFPDIALQFGHVIAKSLRAGGYEQIEVRATVMASLNGRDPQLLIDLAVDLAEQPCTLAPAAWILPLEEPSPA